jgi:hypothetical protein
MKKNIREAEIYGVQRNLRNLYRFCVEVHSITDKSQGGTHCQFERSVFVEKVVVTKLVKFHVIYGKQVYYCVQKSITLDSFLKTGESNSCNPHTKIHFNNIILSSLDNPSNPSHSASLTPALSFNKIPYIF